jgi:hypothetical protein
VLVIGLDAGEEVGKAFWVMRDRKFFQHVTTRQPDGDMVSSGTHIYTNSQFDG